MHYISSEALGVVQGGAKRVPLVKDHAVPVSVLRDYLLEEAVVSESAIQEFLVKNYKLGVITKDDDLQIVSSKLRCGIGNASLDDLYDASSRYTRAGLTVHLCSDVF